MIWATVLYADGTESGHPVFDDRIQISDLPARPVAVIAPHGNFHRITDCSICQGDSLTVRFTYGVPS